MKNLDTRKSYRWNTKTSFVKYAKAHWLKWKDVLLVMDLLKDYIAESVLIKDKLVLSWIWTFQKKAYKLWSRSFRYIRFKQSSYLKSLIKVKW